MEFGRSRASVHWAAPAHAWGVVAVGDRQRKVVGRYGLVGISTFGKDAVL
jgi:hypothetical protein